MKDDWKTKKIDDYVIVNKVLGKGQYGTVYLGYMSSQSQCRIAVKTISMETVKQSPNVLNLVKRETTILKTVNHPNIVRLLNANRTANSIYLFLEFCPDGDLRKFMLSKETKRISELESIIFLKHIAEGFKELFSRKIIHRDIKPENILLSNGVAKIADFGFARVMEVEMDEPGMFSRNGSPIYMSPQILRGQPFSAKCDVWSVGIMFFEMLYGKTPWQGESNFQLEANILNKPLKFPSKPVRSQKVKELIAMMLQIEEKDRIGWPGIFENKLMKIDEDRIRQNMNDVMKVEDPMRRSLSLNKMYLDQNLVMGYFDMLLRVLSTVTDSDSPTQGIAIIFDEIDPDLVVSQYQKEMHRRNEFRKYYEYYLYERNVAFFLNFTLQKLIQLQTFGDITLDKADYFKVIYLLTRNQILHLDRTLDALMSNYHQQFDQDMWGRFRNSRECAKLILAIKKDLQSVGEVNEQITSKQNEIPQWQEIKDVKEFLSNYKQMIAKVLQQLQGGIGRDIYICIYYMRICQNPYEHFKSPDFDFNTFYEEIENLSIEEILSKL